MKKRIRYALALITALALLLSACGAREVDITMTPAPAETPVKEQEPAPAQSPEPGEMVRIVDIIPNIFTDARYASAHNFTGKAIYGSDEVYLRYSTAEKLAHVQERLNALGYSLCVWDGWRPVAAQFALWRAVPDARYVADPFNGASGHCRGNTVDITLVTLDGEPVDMPTDFDDFTARADRDYSDVSAEAAENARLLEREMVSEGFKPYSAEWWHYTDSDEYEVCESLTPLEQVDITIETPLRSEPDPSAGTLGSAAAGESVSVLDRLDGWLLVRASAGYGYIEA